MSEQNQHKDTPDEVDLGQVFRMIGEGLNKLFNFIWAVLKGVFNIIILFILFVRRHVLKFAMAVIVGAGIGYLLDRTQETVYGASLIVEPNFGSTQQLYKNIQYYNNLVAQGDTLLLASTFNLTSEEAASIRELEIKAVENQNSTLQAYNKFLRQAIDSTLRKNYSYEDFKNNVSEDDYSIHEIRVTALKNNIFRALQPVIIGSVTENTYFNIKKQIALGNLKRNDSVLKSAMAEVDSLRNIYTEVLLAEAKRENPQGTTSIVLAENSRKYNELELFNTKIRLKDELNENQIQRAESLEVINIISSFQPVGYKVNIIYKKYYFIFGIAGASLMFLYLVFKELNTFLNAYQIKEEA